MVVRFLLGKGWRFPVDGGVVGHLTGPELLGLLLVWRRRVVWGRRRGPCCVYGRGRVLALGDPGGRGTEGRAGLLRMDTGSLTGSRWQASSRSSSERSSTSKELSSGRAQKRIVQRGARGSSPRRRGSSKLEGSSWVAGERSGGFRLRVSAERKEAAAKAPVLGLGSKGSEDGSRAVGLVGGELVGRAASRTVMRPRRVATWDSRRAIRASERERGGGRMYC